jgi:hypothetical protein
MEEIVAKANIMFCLSISIGIKFMKVDFTYTRINFELFLYKNAWIKSLIKVYSLQKWIL